LALVAAGSNLAQTPAPTCAGGGSSAAVSGFVRYVKTTEPPGSLVPRPRQDARRVSQARSSPAGHAGASPRSFTTVLSGTGKSGWTAVIARSRLASRAPASRAGADSHCEWSKPFSRQPPVYSVPGEGFFGASRGVKGSWRCSRQGRQTPLLDARRGNPVHVATSRGCRSSSRANAIGLETRNPHPALAA